MHPNVKKGTQIHADHFDSIIKRGWIAPGWEVVLINQQIGSSGLRPDWVIMNELQKKAYIIDITARYTPSHYEKGLNYVSALKEHLNDPSWEIVYLEDYWLNATLH